MKKSFTLLLVAFLSGCGGSKPYPAERLVQPAGGFSYVTPAGWYRTKLAGIAFIIVSTDADYGVCPNIYVDRVAPGGSLHDAVAGETNQNKSNYSSYAIEGQADFATASGLYGLKITAARKNKDNLPLALFHYLFVVDARLVVITCSCAGPVKDKYEGMFDQAMKSLQSEEPRLAAGRPTRSIGIFENSAGSKVDRQKLEKNLDEFKKDAIVKGVQPLSITAVDEMKKKVAARTGMRTLPGNRGMTDGYICDFRGHSLAMFLYEYSRLTGKAVVLEVPEPAAGITFKLERALPFEEAARAMELFLAKEKNIVLVVDGTNELRAVEGKAKAP